MLGGVWAEKERKVESCVFLQGLSGYFKVKYEMYPSKCGQTCGCRGLGYTSRSCHAVTDLSPDPSLCSGAPGCCGSDTCRRLPGSVRSCWRSSLPSEPRLWPCRHEESGEDGGTAHCLSAQHLKLCTEKTRLLPEGNVISCSVTCFTS